MKILEILYADDIVLLADGMQGIYNIMLMSKLEINC